MNKLAKIKLTAELLEAAGGTLRSTALDKIRWNDDYHLECNDRWDDEELISKLTPAGQEILDVVELLITMLEGLV